MSNACVDAAETVKVINPAISIDKSVDKPTVIAGTLVTYTIKVSNNGDSTLSHVTVSDNTFPGCSKADGDIPNLAPQGQPGDSFTYTCTATINSDTTNTATTTGTTESGGTVTAHDSADVDVIHPSIAIDKSVDKPTVVAGTLVTYTIKVSNTGDATLSHVTVSTTRSRAAARRTGHSDQAPMGQPGDSFTYTCTATINADTTNTATTSAKAPAGPDVTAHDSADVDVIHPSIAVDKSVDKPTVVAGTLVTYTIKVSNTGDATL